MELNRYGYAYDPSYHGDDADRYLYFLYRKPILKTLPLNGIDHDAHALIEDCLSKYRPLSEIMNPRNIQQNPQDLNEWYRAVNSAQKVRLGKLKINYALVVNVHDDWTFDHLLCSVTDDRGLFRLVFDYRDLLKGTISRYFERFHFNPDDPKRKYLSELFYHVLLHCSDNLGILNIPSASGWQCLPQNHIYFAASHLIHPELETYYPSDVQERKLFDPASLSLRTFQEIMSDYKPQIPSDWKYRFLVTLRVASLLMFFFDRSLSDPKHFFLIQPASESNVSLISALLNTQNYENDTVCSLSDKPKVIRNALHSTNDGIALFRDCFLNDNQKTLSSRCEILVNDLHHADSSAAGLRHIIAIITNKPMSFPSELPTLLLQFEQDAVVQNITALQKLSAEFDRSVINTFENLTYEQRVSYFNRIQNDFNAIWSQAPFNHKSIFFLVYASSQLLLHNGFLSAEDNKEIIAYITQDKTSFHDVSLSIRNEFSKSLNELIHAGELRLCPQFSIPFYQNDGHSAFFDDTYLNMEAECVDTILNKMTTSITKTKLFAILKDNDDLYAKLSGTYTRTVKVSVSRYQKESKSVHSISLNLLDEESLEILSDQKQGDFYIASSSCPPHFVPYIHNRRRTRLCGRYQMQDKLENYHMFVCGVSGFGKSFFLLQQALFHFRNGEKVLIFDQNNAFSSSELQNSHRLPERLVTNLFRTYDLQSAMPIDLFDMRDCASVTDAEEKIYAILSAIVPDMGSVQESVLTSIVHNIVSSLGINVSYTPDQILEFVTTEDNTQKTFIQRIRNILEVIGRSSISTQTWSELFKEQAIIIISASNKAARHRNKVFDMLLASFFNYKISDSNARSFIILDELQKQNLTANAPIDMIIREGRKYNLFMLLASQNYPGNKTSMGRIVSNADTKVYFRQSEESISEIRSRKINKNTLCELEVGMCIIEGNIYNQRTQNSELGVIMGHTADIRDHSIYASVFPELSELWE